MTLNITVANARCIYQCADYRFIDWANGEPIDLAAQQKIQLITRSTWHATVCFNGVGRFRELMVSDWLSERLGSINQGDPFERLLEELVGADAWLREVPPPHNKHSFSVGAFVHSTPIFAIVTNYEPIGGPPRVHADDHLSVSQIHPTRPKTFVSGQRSAVTREARWRLAALASVNSNQEDVFSALARTNRDAARSNSLISPACFTTYVRRTGEGGGAAHGIDVPFLPPMSLPQAAIDAMKSLLDRQFGPGRYRMAQMATVRADASEQYHRVQLQDKPHDPNTHSNYGAFLYDKKKDIDGAEEAYRRALALDPKHANALGNLANLLAARGERTQARDFYASALATSPGAENATWNYAHFLVREYQDRSAARNVLNSGIEANPQSGRLLQYRADLDLLDGKAHAALEGYVRARNLGADQAHVEGGVAMALQISGAPVKQCIEAYRTAVALNPDNGALKLNLAQLLFVKGALEEAHSLVHLALKSGLDASAQLEAQFYLLAHTQAAPKEVLESIKHLLERGARLQWNVQANMDAVRAHDARKAQLLDLVVAVLTGEKEAAQLGDIIRAWPSSYR